jgi:hypothetical protein
MPTAVRSQIAELIAVAEELFDGEVRVEQVSDPEIPGRDQTVLQVSASGTVDNVNRLRLEWYRRTMDLLGDDYDTFALAVTLVDDDGE